MIYTPLTNKALRFAYNAHHGQLDYNGIPYIFHPLHLAEQMDDELSCTVALLHDTVEDTHVTLADLAKEFPPEVVDALALLIGGFLAYSFISYILAYFGKNKKIEDFHAGM